MLSNYKNQIVEFISSDAKYSEHYGKIVLSETPKKELGDLSLSFFQMAKETGISPKEISDDIVKRFNFPNYISEIKQDGLYLNLFFNRAKFVVSLFSETQKDNYGFVDLGKNKKALIEHTSINPNASPHVGRARNAIIGDTISRLLKFLNYDLEVHYYVNDMGKQIAMLVLACQDNGNISFEEILDIYVKANERLENDKEFEQEVFKLLKLFEDGDKDVQKKFKDLVNISVNGQQEILKRLNILYDKFDYESSFVHNEELEVKINSLKEMGIVFIDEDNRTVLDLQKIGFDREEGRYSVLKRGNNSSMYGYRDIAYHIHKLSIASEKGQNFVVLGEDHNLYYEQLSLILKTLGYIPPEVIHYSFIRLKEGKMSTRKGNVVFLSSFLDEATKLAKERIQQNVKNISDNIDELAEIIGTGAVRFNIIKVKPTSSIIFDWDQALSFEGSTGPYVQYTYVRAKSILNAFGENIPSLNLQEDFTISHLAWALVFSLSSFDEILIRTKDTSNPSLIANYLVDISQKFNSFYHETRILDNEMLSTKVFGLNVCKSTIRVIENGMNLLGISLPSKM